GVETSVQMHDDARDQRRVEAGIDSIAVGVAQVYVLVNRIIPLRWQQSETSTAADVQVDDFQDFRSLIRSAVGNGATEQENRLAAAGQRRGAKSADVGDTRTSVVERYVPILGRGIGGQVCTIQLDQSRVVV